MATKQQTQELEPRPEVPMVVRAQQTMDPTWSNGGLFMTMGGSEVKAGKLKIADVHNTMGGGVEIVLANGRHYHVSAETLFNGLVEGLKLSSEELVKAARAKEKAEKARRAELTQRARKAGA